MRLVWDIDGTLCNNTNGEYEKAQPYPEMIDLVNSLYDQGHTIVLNTARGMGRFEGNIGLVNKQWYAFTQNQLSDWGVKYHELHLGKILGDVYIDDRGFRIRADGGSAAQLELFLSGDVSPDE